MKKKLKIVVLTMLCCGSIFASDYSYSKFDSEAYIHLTINGENIYKASNTTTYFKDTVSYIWNVADETEKTILWFNDVRYLGSDEKTLSDTELITMKCTKEEKNFWGNWKEKGSETQSYSFIKDTKSPNISLKKGNTTLSENCEIYDKTTSAPIFQYNVTDSEAGVSSIQVYLNGTLKSSSDNSIKLDKEGIYTIKFVAIDRVGNKKEVIYKYIWDHTEPSLTVNNEKLKTWTSSVTVSASATDVVSGIDNISYSVNGSENKKGDSIKFGEGSYSDTGIYKVIFTAVDKAKNEKQSNETEVWIDKNVPSITISGKGLNGWANSATIAASGIDENSGIDNTSWKYSLDGGTTWSKEHSNNNSVVVDKEGQYSIIFKVKDKVGNEGVSPTTIINIDKTGPSLSYSVTDKDGKDLLKDNELYKNKEEGYIKIISTDIGGSGVEKIEWELIQGIFSKKKESSSEIDLLTNSPGLNEIKIWAEDNVGNKSNEEIISIYIDQEAPQIEIVDETKGQWVKNAIVRAFSNDKDIKKDSWKIYYKNEGEDSITEGQGDFINLSDHGQKMIWFEVEDILGNVATTQNNPTLVKIDKNAPIISCHSIDTGKVNRNIQAIAKDDDSGVDEESYKYIINMNTGEKIEGFGSLAILPEGENQSVTFFVCDKVGNIASVSSEPITVDISGPSINFNVNKYAYKDEDKYLLEITDLYVKDNFSSEANINLSYIINQKEPKEFFPNNNKFEIDVSDLNEDTHSIRIAAKDSSDNETVSEEYYFIVDKTNPEIYSIEYLYDDKKIEEGSFIGDKDLTIRISHSVEENISYMYAVSSNINDEIEWVTFDSSSLNLGAELSPGENYIYIKIVDSAKNESKIKKFNLFKDTVQPGSPIITSSTHRKATSVADSERKSNANFIIKTTKFSDAGIKNIEYKLYEATEKNIAGNLIKEGSCEITTETNLYFQDLKDNKENCFYFLEVWCVGGNNIKSDVSTYCFRIDTTPPKDLEISIEPQVESQETFYNAAKANISWNQPADITGIAKYDLKIYSSTTEEEKNIIFSKCGITTREEIVDIKSKFEDSGKIIVEVTAYDYAGNSKNNSRSFYVDFVAPKVEEGITIETDSCTENEISANLSWGDITEKGSGLDYIIVEYLRVIEDGNAKKIRIDVNSEGTISNSCTLPNLVNDSTYLVNVTVYDKAGNSVRFEQIITIGKVEPEEIAIQYTETINNILFFGTKIIKGSSCSFDEIKMKIPSNIKIEKEFLNGETKSFQEIPFTSFSINENFLTDGSYECSSDENLLIAVDETEFSCKGISYSSKSGLSFLDANITIPVETNNKDLKFDEINIGFPNSIFINAYMNIKEDKEIIKTDFYSLSNIKNICINGDCVFWENNIYLKFDIEDQEKKLYLKNVFSDIKTGQIEGTIEDQELELAGTKYFIKNGFIQGNLLTIYEAQVNLPEEFKEDFIVIKNFAINLDSKSIVALKEFSVSDISISKDNKELIWDTKVTLDENGKLILSCTSNIGDTFPEVKITGANLIEFNLNSDVNLDVSEFSIELYGFICNIEKINLKNKKLKVIEGKINIYGQEFNIGDLILNLNEENSVEDTYKLSGIICKDFGYGEEIQIKNIQITSEGIFSEEILAPLYGTEKKLCFQGRLLSTGEIESFYEGNFETKITDFTLEIFNASFDGKEITVLKGEIETIKGFSSEKLKIEDLRLNINGITQNGQGIGDYTYTFDGWEAKFKSINFTERGIEGPVFIEYEKETTSFAEYEVWSVEYNNFLIKSDKDVVTQKEDLVSENSMFYVNGFYFELGVGCFEKIDDKYLLICDSINLLDTTVKTQSIKLGKATISSDGKITTEKAQETSAIYSLNDYIIYPETAFYDGEKIIFEGSVTPIEWENCRFEKKKIFLYNNFYAEIQETVSEIKYTYAGWDITAENVSFGQNKIQTYSNTVKYLDAEISLGDFNYYSTGAIIKTGVSFDYQSVPIISDESVITETRFNSEGLYVSLEIALPFMSESNTVCFDSVHLYQNGKYFAESYIREKEIDFGSVNLYFESLILKESGIYVDSFIMNIPALENLQISLEGLVIKNNGEIILEGCATSPFQLWNMIFVLDDLSIESNEVSIQGSVQLPSSLPGILANRMIALDKFVIGFDGKVKVLDARLKGEYVIPLFENWKLSFTSLGLGYSEEGPTLLMDDTSIIFPSGYGIDKVGISSVSFNPVTGAFDYDKISAALSLNTEISGINFRFNELYITKNKTVGFGGAAKFVGEDFPQFLIDKEVDVKTFEILPNGTIGSIDIQLNNLEGKISKEFEAMELRDGSVRIGKVGDKDLILSISGALEFTDKGPDFLRQVNNLSGIAFRIEEFTINPMNPSIDRFTAYLSRQQEDSTWSRDPKYIDFDPVFMGNKLNDIYVSLEYSGESSKGELAVSGGLILPDSLPEGIKGTEVRLNNFIVETTGAIREFDAIYTSEKAYLGSINLNDTLIRASLLNEKVEYRVGTTLELPKEKFPEGIGGLTTSASFVFTSDTLKEVEAAIKVPDGPLMNSVEMKGIQLSLVKNQNTDMLISLVGSVVLPSTLPQGLAGMEVGVKKLTINKYGEFQDVDIGATNISASLFGGLALSNGGINFSKGTANEFLINVTGNLAFTGDSIPDDLKNASFAIDELLISTKTGIVSFSAGSGCDLSCTVLGGVELNLNKLWFTEKGFTADASAGLNFPDVDFGNARFDASLDMTWKGEIINFSGGLGALNVKVAGFNGKIEELYIKKSSTSEYFIELKECRIFLPENMGSMGGKSIALKEASFNPKSGEFNGDFEIPTIRSKIAGFELVFHNPSLILKEEKFSFTKVELNLPEFLGTANVSLNEVSVSSAKGLIFNGGAFSLPDFVVGELGFKNIGAEFVQTDSTYYVTGHGGLLLPGVGVLEASLTFTEKSNLYPIGLKAAYFSYEASVKGLPLGTTGLYLSGIRGGFAYGSPDEVPEQYRNLFGENGARLQLGLTIKDATGGSAVKINADTWVDVTDFIMVVEGNTTILSGTLNITGNAFAVFDNDLFAAGLNFQIKFIRGEIEFYVFTKQGTLKFSGRGCAILEIPRGCLVNGKIIKIPKSTYPLPKAEVMFGDFTNGKRGFLAYVDISIGSIKLAKVGAFVGSGGLDLKIKNYEILRPDGFSTNQSARTMSIRNFDNRGSVPRNLYKVYIPGNEGNVSSYSLYQMRGVQRAAPEPERLATTIFILGYVDGDPSFTVISPSGQSFKSDNPAVKTEYFENGMMIEVTSPEIGEWSLVVDNMEEGSYELSVLGVESVPEVVLTSPRTGISIVEDEIFVTGTTTRGNGEVSIFAAKDRTSNEIEIGTLYADENGYFEGSIPVDTLGDGEYVIIARTLTYDGLYSLPSYSEGTCRIDRTGKELLPPASLYVTEIAKGQIKASWENTNAARTYGYLLKINNKTTGKESINNVGNISEINLPGYLENEELDISVACYDQNKNQSEYSDIFNIKINEEKTVYYKPYVNNNTVSLSGIRGDFAEGVVIVEYKDFNDRENRFYLSLDLEAAVNEEIEISFGDSFIASENGNYQEFVAYVSEKCLPGTYEIPCKIVNENNYKDVSDFNIVITVENPCPTISSIEPSIINLSSSNTILVYGTGFIEGTKYFLDDKELSVFKDDTNSLTMKKLIIPEDTLRGERLIKVIGPTGNKAESTLSVIAPGYDINIFTKQQSMHAGETAKYPVKINSFDGYDKDVTITGVNVPEGFYVEIPDFEFGETGYISVISEDYVNVGTYQLAFSTGKLDFELSVEIVEEEISPIITSVLTNRIYRGSVVHLNGFGFKNSGNLYLNGILMDTLNWEENSISFEIPEDFEIGRSTLVVETDVGYSNDISINIVECNYSIYVNKGIITIIAGETIESNIAINGYAENIYLNTNYDTNAPFTVSLSSNKVDTNALVELKIETQKDAKLGIYEILISGLNEYQSAETILTIKIENPFEILTKTIPTGTVGVFYDAEVETSLQKEEIFWNLEDGNLPRGIKLSKEGRLFGIPEQAGVYTFELSCQNSSNVLLKEKYTLIINEDSWSFNGKNSGNVNSISGDIPSENKKQWEIKNTDKVKSIILGAKQAAVITEEEVFGIETSSGRILWTLNDTYKDSFIGGNKIFGLTEEGVFESRALFSGLLSWSRENIDSYSSDGSALLLKEKDTFVVIDVATGQKISEIDKCYANTKNIIWHNGNAFEWKDNILCGIYGISDSIAFDANIKNVAVDGNGFVVVTENEIILLDTKLQKQQSVGFFSEETTNIAINTDSIVLQDSRKTIMYNRESLDIIWISFGGNKVALANEKVIILTSDDLKVLNAYTGKEIWNYLGVYDALSCKANTLYVANTDNIIAFNGKANATAPKTNISVSIEEPNGKNDWYNTLPSLSIEAVDIETYVESIFIDYNETGYHEYDEQLVLQDGINKISAYGIDSNGLIGEADELEIKIDISEPHSELIVNAEENSLGWYNENICVQVKAYDYISGIEDVYVNGIPYEGPISYTEEGIYSLRWNSTDIAGNVETENTKTIRIDKFNPTTSSLSKQDLGITVVELFAGDSGSGINRIEYSIDNGLSNIYQKPIVILEEGWHTLVWEAFDNSGKSSGIQCLDIYVMKDASYGKILALAELNGKTADVDILDYSSFMYTWNVSGNRYGDGIPEKYWQDIYDNFWSKNSFATLPKFVLGAEYIKYKATDLMIEEKRNISFYVRDNAVIYMFAGPDLPVENTWTLIDEHAYIQNSWYPDGWKLYMKRVEKGEKVNVYAGTRDVALPVIAVKKEPIVDTEITLERYASWDDSIYGEIKQFRPGVLIHLDAIVTPQEPEVDLPVTRKWTLYIDGVENEISTLWYTIPNVEKETEFTFEYTITSTDGKLESKSEKTIKVYPIN